MSRKPCARRLRAADSSTLSNVAGGHADRARRSACARSAGRRCLPARRRSPARRARCRARARSSRPAPSRARCACRAPCAARSARCRRSGTSTVVLPARSCACNSVDVRSSRNTLRCACAQAATGEETARQRSEAATSAHPAMVGDGDIRRLPRFASVARVPLATRRRSARSAARRRFSAARGSPAVAAGSRLAAQQDVVVAAHAIDERDRHAAARVAVLRA